MIFKHAGTKCSCSLRSVAKACIRPPQQVTALLGFGHIHDAHFARQILQDPNGFLASNTWTDGQRALRARGILGGLGHFDDPARVSEQGDLRHIDDFAARPEAMLEHPVQLFEQHLMQSRNVSGKSGGRVHEAQFTQ
jgi:hypothetical protein